MLKLNRFFCSLENVPSQAAAPASAETPSRGELEQNLASCRSHVEALEREKAQLRVLVEELQLAARRRERPAPRSENAECYRSEEGRVYNYRVAPEGPDAPRRGQTEWTLAMKWADELRRRRFAEEKLADVLAYVAHLQALLAATERLLERCMRRRKRATHDVH